MIISPKLLYLTLSLLGVLFLRKKNELFLLESAFNLTYDILTRKLNKIFFKVVIQKHKCVKFDAFSRRNSSFFPKNKTLRSESVNDILFLCKNIRFKK